VSLTVCHAALIEARAQHEPVVYRVGLKNDVISLAIREDETLDDIRWELRLR
jgi:hypothetical protein